VITQCLFFAVVGTSSEGLDEEVFKFLEMEILEPSVINLKNGRIITGHIRQVVNEQLQIVSSEGIGEAIFKFNLDEISEIGLPGDTYKEQSVEWMEMGKLEAARKLMEVLFKQRASLLPVLKPEEVHFFINLIHLNIALVNPARSIAIDELLRPHLIEQRAIDVLDDARLDSYNKLKLYKKARPLAEKWIIDRQPDDRSAIGYYIVSAEHLRSREPEKALEMALKPIAFSSYLKVEKLAHCYSVAIGAALDLRENKYAQILYKEMQNRDLVWPEDEMLASYLTRLQSLNNKQ
jgi:hypothetical protein